MIITASTAASFALAKKDLSALFDVVQLDVADLKAIDGLVAYIKTKYARLDVLFANAGVAFFIPTPDYDEATYDRIMNVNVCVAC